MSSYSRRLTSSLRQLILLLYFNFLFTSAKHQSASSSSIYLLPSPSTGLPNRAFGLPTSQTSPLEASFVSSLNPSLSFNNSIFNTSLDQRTQDFPHSNFSPTSASTALSSLSSIRYQKLLSTLVPKSPSNITSNNQSLPILQNPSASQISFLKDKLKEWKFPSLSSPPQIPKNWRNNLPNIFKQPTNTVKNDIEFSTITPIPVTTLSSESTVVVSPIPLANSSKHSRSGSGTTDRRHGNEDHEDETEQEKEDDLGHETVQEKLYQHHEDDEDQGFSRVPVAPFVASLQAQYPFKGTHQMQDDDDNESNMQLPIMKTGYPNQHLVYPMFPQEFRTTFNSGLLGRFLSRRRNNFAMMGPPPAPGLFMLPYMYHNPGLSSQHNAFLSKKQFSRRTKFRPQPYPYPTYNPYHATMMGLYNSNHGMSFNKRQRPSKVFALPHSTEVPFQPQMTYSNSFPVSTSSSVQTSSSPEVLPEKLNDCPGNGVTPSSGSKPLPSIPSYHHRKKNKLVHPFFAVRPPFNAMGFPVRIRRPPYMASPSNRPPAVGLLRPNLSPVIPVMNPFMIPWFHPMSIWPSLMTTPGLYSTAGRPHRYPNTYYNHRQYPVTSGGKVISSQVIPPSPASSIKGKNRQVESKPKSLDSGQMAAANVTNSSVSDPNIVLSPNITLGSNAKNTSKPKQVLTGLSSLGEQQQQLLWEALQQSYRMQQLKQPKKSSSYPSTFSPLDLGIGIMSDLQKGQQDKNSITSNNNTIHRNGLDPLDTLGHHRNQEASSLSSSFPSLTPKEHHDDWSFPNHPDFSNNEFFRNPLKTLSDQPQSHHRVASFSSNNLPFSSKGGSHSFSSPSGSVWFTKSQLGSSSSFPAKTSSSSHASFSRLDPFNLYYSPPSSSSLDSFLGKKKIPASPASSFSRSRKREKINTSNMAFGERKSSLFNNEDVMNNSSGRNPIDASLMFEVHHKVKDTLSKTGQQGDLSDIIVHNQENGSSNNNNNNDSLIRATYSFPSSPDSDDNNSKQTETIQSSLKVTNVAASNQTEWHDPSLLNTSEDDEMESIQENTRNNNNNKRIGLLGDPSSESANIRRRHGYSRVTIPKKTQETNYKDQHANHKYSRRLDEEILERVLEDKDHEIKEDILYFSPSLSTKRSSSHSYSLPYFKLNSQGFPTPSGASVSSFTTTKDHKEKTTSTPNILTEGESNSKSKSFSGSLTTVSSKTFMPNDVNQDKKTEETTATQDNKEDSEHKKEEDITSLFERFSRGNNGKSSLKERFEMLSSEYQRRNQSNNRRRKRHAIFDNGDNVTFNTSHNDAVIFEVDHRFSSNPYLLLETTTDAKDKIARSFRNFINEYAFDGILNQEGKESVFASTSLPEMPTSSDNLLLMFNLLLIPRRSHSIDIDSREWEGNKKNKEEVSTFSSSRELLFISKEASRGHRNRRASHASILLNEQDNLGINRNHSFPVQDLSNPFTHHGTDHQPSLRKQDDEESPSTSHHDDHQVDEVRVGQTQEKEYHVVNQDSRLASHQLDSESPSKIGMTNSGSFPSSSFVISEPDVPPPLDSISSQFPDFPWPVNFSSFPSNFDDESELGDPSNQGLPHTSAHMNPEEIPPTFYDSSSSNDESRSQAQDLGQDHHLHHRPSFDSDDPPAPISHLSPVSVTSTVIPGLSHHHEHNSHHDYQFSDYQPNPNKSVYVKAESHANEDHSHHHEHSEDHQPTHHEDYHHHEPEHDHDDHEYHKVEHHDDSGHIDHKDHQDEHDSHDHDHDTYHRKKHNMKGYKESQGKKNSKYSGENRFSLSHR